MVERPVGEETDATEAEEDAEAGGAYDGEIPRGAAYEPPREGRADADDDDDDKDVIECIPDAFSRSLAIVPSACENREPYARDAVFASALRESAGPGGGGGLIFLPDEDMGRRGEVMVPVSGGCDVRGGGVEKSLSMPPAAEGEGTVRECE